MRTKNGRLRRARAQAGYDYAAEAAKDAGWPPSTYAAHENGNRGFRRDVARVYSEFFGVKLEWLLTGTGPMQCEGGPESVKLRGENYCLIPRFDARLSAGPGSLLAERPEPMGFLPVDLQWLRTISPADPKFFAALRVDGDAMAPVFCCGDWVILGITQRNASRGGVYVLNTGGAILLKRLSMDLKSGNIRVISDNPYYETQEVNASIIEIVGRILCVVLKIV